MTSGSKGFLQRLKDICASLDLATVIKNPKALTDAKSDKKAKSDAKKLAQQENKIHQLFRQALFQQWQSKERCNPLGWDPVSFRAHALRAIKPEDEGEVSSEPAAVWLAAEAIPLFPCAVVGNQLVTRGFSQHEQNKKSDDEGDSSNGKTDSQKRTKRRERITVFSYPIWDVPATLDVVRSLLGRAELTAEELQWSKMKSIGVVEVFRAHRIALGDRGYAIFSSAYPVCKKTNDRRNQRNKKR